MIRKSSEDQRFSGIEPSQLGTLNRLLRRAPLLADAGWLAGTLAEKQLASSGIKTLIKTKIFSGRVVEAS